MAGQWWAQVKRVSKCGAAAGMGLFDFRGTVRRLFHAAAAGGRQHLAGLNRPSGLNADAQSFHGGQVVRR